MFTQAKSALNWILTINWFLNENFPFVRSSNMNFSLDGRWKQNLHYHIALHVYAIGSERKKKIEFITSFMKPIMRSHVMVVERRVEVELIGFFEHSLPWTESTIKITKPDRTNTPEHHTPEELVSTSRMFRRCFQFRFNIRFVQFRKIVSSLGSLCFVK